MKHELDTLVVVLPGIMGSELRDADGDVVWGTGLGTLVKGVLTRASSIKRLQLPDDHGLFGTVVHNPRSNMNNSVGYGRPARFDNRVALGTDGIGADMLDEFRLAFVKSREVDVTLGPDLAWGWLETGWDLFPEARNDRVTWNYVDMDPWRLAYTTGLSPLTVEADHGAGLETLWADGGPTRVEGDEIRAKAAEAANRLFARLES